MAPTERIVYERDDSDEETTDSHESGEEGTDESEDSDHEDPEVAVRPSQNSISKPVNTSSRKRESIQANHVQESMDDSGTDSDSDSPSDSPPPTPAKKSNANYNPKPLAAKIVDEKQKSVKKKQASVSKKDPDMKDSPAGKVMEEKPKSKRKPIMPGDDVHKTKKSKKEKAINDLAHIANDISPQKNVGDMKKQQPFQKIWSHEDELAILRGMISYSSEKGADPSSNLKDFHHYIANSLNIQVTVSQLSSKIVRLKKKYQSMSVKVRNVEELPNVRDRELFDLSSKIWCNLSCPPTPRSKGKVLEVGEVSQQVANGVDHHENSIKAEVTGDSLSLSETISYYNAAGFGSCERFLRSAMGDVDEAQRSELEESWKSMNIMISEVVLQRAKLAQRQIEVILKASKK